jgi:hypothetical protein
MKESFRYDPAAQFRATITTIVSGPISRDGESVDDERFSDRETGWCPIQGFLGNQVDNNMLILSTEVRGTESPESTQMG